MAMTPTAWIALATLSFTVIATVISAVVAAVIWIGGKLDDIKATGNQRHEDNLIRFSRVDNRLDSIDALIRNGYGGHRAH